jgi:hypothetical protein
MELTTTATDILFLAGVAILSLMPILALPSAWKVFRIWKADEDRPRNAILQTLTGGTIINALASAFFALLTIGFWRDTFNGVPPDADFGGVLFVIVLIAVGYVPFMKLRTINKLMGREVDIQEVAETQNQREDREFGAQRRELEVKHNKDLTASE